MHVAAYDFEGKKQWEQRPGVFSSVHGYCSSPILWKDKVIINGDHDGESYIVALEKKSGKPIWKTPLPGKGHASPVVWHDYVFVVTAVENTREPVTYTHLTLPTNR